MLSDLLRPRVIELGKIKIGKKGDARQGSSGSWRMPVKLDHFLITTMQRDKQTDDLALDNDLMASLVDQGYGDTDGKLREIPVAVLSNDIEEVMQAAWVWYIGKRLAGRCEDNKKVTLWANPDNGKWYERGPQQFDWTPDMAERRDAKKNRMFKLHSTLNVVIAAENARFGGVYKFRTTSTISAEQLFNSLHHVADLTPGKILRGMPLSLVVRPVQVSPDGQTTTVYVVHLELRGRDLAAIQQQALDIVRNEVAFASEFRENRIQYRKLLAIPGDEGEVDRDEIVGEFVPEQATPPAAITGGIDPLAAQLGIDGGEPTPPIDPPAPANEPPANPTPADAPAPAPEPTPAPQPEAPPAADEHELPHREPGWDPDEDDEPERQADPTPAPAAVPSLPQAKVDLIFTELRRLDCAWNSDETRGRVSVIIGREVPAGAPPSSLTPQEFDVLMAKLVNASKPKPKKAGAAK